jgi:hypothetical protein
MPTWLEEWCIGAARVRRWNFAAAGADARFSTKEVATVRRIAATGRPVLEIQKKLRRNTNAIVAYLRAHGLQRTVRIALARAAA